MRRCAFLLVVLVAALALVAAPAAQADFGISEFDVSFENEDGSPDTQAGAHPYAMTISFEVNTEEGSEGDARDVAVELPPGLVANPTAVPCCSTVDFVAVV